MCVCAWEKLYSCCLFGKAGKKRAKASTITGIILNSLVNSSAHQFAASYAEPPSPPPLTPPPLRHTQARMLILLQLVNFTSRITLECIATTRHFSHCGKFQDRPFHVPVKLKQLLQKVSVSWVCALWTFKQKPFTKSRFPVIRKAGIFVLLQIRKLDGYSYQSREHLIQSIMTNVN